MTNCPVPEVLRWQPPSPWLHRFPSLACSRSFPHHPPPSHRRSSTHAHPRVPQDSGPEKCIRNSNRIGLYKGQINICFPRVRWKRTCSSREARHEFSMRSLRLVWACKSRTKRNLRSDGLLHGHAESNRNNGFDQSWIEIPNKLILVVWSSVIFPLIFRQLKWSWFNISL